MTFAADEEKCPYQSERLFLGEDFSPISSAKVLGLLLLQNKWENLMRRKDALVLILTPEPPGNILPN